MKMYPRRILFVLLAIFCCVIIPTVYGNLPDLSTLCPYNNFCTKNATKTMPANDSYLIPCCQQCSCDPDCQLFGTCCPDKDLTPGVQVRYPCVSIDDYFNEPRSISPSNKYEISYHVINDCPTSDLLTEHPRCTDLQQLEDFAFVSDPVTDRVYQNKHCAKCNGVSNYIEWFVATNCTKLTFLTLDKWLDHLNRSCELTPIPPHKLAGHASRCYFADQSDILKCNSSGEWNTLDTEILDACEADKPQRNDRYYQEFTWTEKKVYNNPYCKLCNSNDGEDLLDLCRRLPYFGESSAFFVQVPELINLVIGEDAVEESSPYCNLPNLWDPFKESCVTVACPASSIFLAGKCKDMYRRLPQENYNIFFKVDTEFEYFSRLKVNALHKILSERIPNTHCYHCETSLVHHNPVTVHLRYTIRTGDTCTEDYLIDQVKLMILDPPVYQFSKAKSCQLLPALHMSNSQIHFAAATHRGNVCENTVDLNHRFFNRCPKIALADLDLSVFEHTDLDYNRTLNNHEMCVYEYFSLMQSLKGSTRVIQYYWVSEFLLVVAYYVILENM